MDIAVTPTSFLPTLANPCLLPVPGPTQQSELFQHWLLKQLDVRIKQTNQPFTLASWIHRPKYKKLKLQNA